MLKIEVDDAAARARLARAPSAVRAALVAEAAALDKELIDRVRGKAPRRTGALAASIRGAVSATQTSVQARVWPSGDRAKAAAIEFGAHIPSHDIVPDRAQALRFMTGGKVVFAKRVRNPGATIGARPFLRPAFAEMRDEIMARLVAAARRGAGLA